MEPITILTLIWLHFIADFVLQTREMATKKSSDLYWLSCHVTVYTITFMLFFGPIFALMNGVLHFVTDFITSRLTTHFYKKENMQMFFTTIGFDQAIHASTLILTYVWLF